MRTFYPEHFSVEELQLLSVIFLNGGKSKTNSADFLKKNKIWDAKCSAGLDDYLSQLIDKNAIVTTDVYYLPYSVCLPPEDILVLAQTEQFRAVFDCCTKDGGQYSIHRIFWSQMSWETKYYFLGAILTNSKEVCRMMEENTGEYYPEVCFHVQHCFYMFGDGSCFQFPQTENMSILSEFLPVHCFVHAEKYSEENQMLSQDGRIFTAFYQGNRERLESYAANSNVAAALLDAWNGQWVQQDKALMKCVEIHSNPSFFLYLTGILLVSRAQTAVSRFMKYCRQIPHLSFEKNVTDLSVNMLENLYYCFGAEGKKCKYSLSGSLNPFEAFLLSICAALDPNYSWKDSVLQEVKKYAAKFRENGWLLPAVWMEHAISCDDHGEFMSSGSCAADTKQPEMTPIVVKKQPIQLWVSALEELALVGKKGSAADADRVYHVTWNLILSNEKSENPKLIKIIPKLCSYRKNGTLTSGRIVSVDKIRFDYMQYVPEQERAVLSLVYHDYYESQIKASAVEILIGSDNVYYDNKKVELTKETNGIVVTKRKNGYHLQIKFQEDSYTDLEYIQLIKHGSSAFSCVIPDETSKNIRKIFEKYSAKKNGGILVPQEGFSRLGQILAHLPREVELSGNLPDIMYADLQDLPAEINFVMRMRRKSSSEIEFELRNRPVQNMDLVQIPGEGSSFFPIETESGRKRLTRNFHNEIEAANQLLKKCPTLNDQTGSHDYLWCFFDPLDILNVLSEIQDSGVAIEYPENEKISISSPVSFSSFHFRDNAESNWFDLDGTAKIDEEKLISFSEFLNSYENRTGNYIRLSEKKYLRLTHKLVQQIDILKSSGRMKKNILSIQPGALPAIDSVLGEDAKVLPAAFHTRINKLHSVFAEEYDIPQDLRTILRPYQAVGYEFMRRMANCGIGCCLADDMGLGKTIEILAVLLAERQNGPALIVAPASVCRNWQSETENFAPVLHPVLCSVNNHDDENVKSAGAGDMVIVSYSMLQSREKIFSAVKWHVVVLDEAQAIKNHTTKRSRSVKSLSADIRIAATGTPIENHVGELWSIFEFLNPGFLGGESEFIQKFCGENGNYELLKKMTAPLILRRLKSDVLKDLPPRTEINIPVVMSDDERTMYEALRLKAVHELTDSKISDSENGQGSSRISILAHLMKLRCFCCHPALAVPGIQLEGSKLIVLRDIVMQIVSGKHKVLVFSQFIGFLKRAEAVFQKDGLRTLYFDGSTDGEERMNKINAFQRGEQDCFCISLKAGGTGINLTAADYVIICDPWWNPAVEDQAAGRSHRIGQKNPVTIYRLVTGNSVEEKVMELHKRKRELAQKLIDGCSDGKLTEKELLSLFM